MKTFLSRSLVSLSLVSAFGLSGSMVNAQTIFPDFVVTETVAGGTAQSLTADKMAGNYVDVIAMSGGSTGTFSLSRRWSVGQFVANNGTTPVTSQLGSATANQYLMYMLFEGTGSYNTVGGVTTFTLNAGGSVRTFLDPSSDTTFVSPAPGTTSWTTGNSNDDILISTGLVSGGQLTLDPIILTCTSGINCGSFGITTSWALTTAGSQFFSAPNPFYNTTFQSGQLNNFFVGGTQTVNGSMDIVFNGTATQPPPQPQLINFATFTPSLQVTYTPGGAIFNFNTTVTLGATGALFDPANNAVSLQIAGVTLTIPAGSFQPNTTGGFTFSGNINGVAVNATIQPQQGTTYRVTIGGSRATLPNLTNPVVVALRIGLNAGTASVTATLAGRPTR